ncbi:Leucine-rich repeat [Carpediemonas membranifera]|uniref:Leucine-rich repeat n=1 Tax=Carpediemonas membranifera TaxID=201153 RepID=A0A8J6AXP6_9EUKA|nr:Leucine-rich repeat [Carpediemonas membranifera]|eukprot:KAG9390963.1 Leucine-rich repeat [Carpediemonas membranifera]
MSTRPIPTLRTPRKRKEENKDENVSLSTIKPIDGRIELVRKNLTTLEGLGDQPRLEFLYLRDNYLTSWQEVGVMSSLKILDIGNNSFTSLRFLSQIPGLRQLYANCNNIVSLSDMPSMPQLEHLSVSHNSIESLVGMPDLPSLRGLCLTGNSLTSFVGFPHLPRLEIIRLGDNPLTEVADTITATTDPNAPTWRQLVIALAGKNLRKIDGADISEDDTRAAANLPSMLIPALQAGYLVGSGLDDDTRTFADPTKLVDDVCAYVVEAQRQELIESQIELAHLTTMPEVVEENKPVTGEIELHANDEVEQHPQWFSWNPATHAFQPIPGATDFTYTPQSTDIGCCLRFEVLVTRGDEPLCTVFALSPDVLETEPECLAIKFDGLPMETETLAIDRKYVGGVEAVRAHETLPFSTVTWSRVSQDGVRTEIASGAFANHDRYTLTLADVDHVIEASYTPARNDGIVGKEVVCCTEAPIKAAKPSAKAVKVVSEDPEAGFVEHVTLQGTGVYYGGRQGMCQYRWYRESQPATPRARARAHREGASTAPTGDPTSDAWAVIEGATAQTYIPTLADVMHHLMFEFTPVSDDGEVGVPRTYVTEMIRPAPPLIIDPAVQGSCLEGEELYVTGKYVGGHEGNSNLQWFVESSKTKAGQPKFTRIANATGRTFTPRREFIGKYVSVKYTPVRDDGVRGDVVVAVSPEAISAAPPTVSRLEIRSFDKTQGTKIVLGIGYLGGTEGETTVSWYRSAPGIETAPDADSDRDWELACDVASCSGRGSIEYVSTSQDIGCWLRVKIVPARDDGIVGNAKTLVMPEAIVAAAPTFERFEFDGEFVEGKTVTLNAVYHGGQPGKHDIEWRVYNSDSDEGVPVDMSELEFSEDGTMTVLRIDSEHVGKRFGARGRPVRVDGTVGPEYTVARSDVVCFAPPAAQLRIIGEPVQGNILDVDVAYIGGKEGASRVRWLASMEEAKEGRKTQVSTRPVGDQCRYTPQAGDVGRTLTIEYTPVRSDGVVGKPCRASVGPVAPCDPAVTAVDIPAQIVEGAPVVLTYSYIGGVEGDTQVSWFTKNTPEDAWTVVSAEREFTPHHNHIGLYLKVEIIPVRTDGVRGEKAVAECSTPIVCGQPTASDVHLEEVAEIPGAFRICYTYSGGEEGESTFRWYRTTTVGSRTRSVIKSATRRVYRATRKDVDCTITGQVVPVRSDKVTGKKVFTEPTDKIRNDVDFAEPTIFEMTLTDAVENTPCAVAGVFDNCTPDSCQYVWTLIDKDGTQTPLDVTGPQFTPLYEHIGMRLAVQCTPVDEEGIVGRMTSAESGTIVAGPPTAKITPVSGKDIGEDAVVELQYLGGDEGETRVVWMRSKETVPEGGLPANAEYEAVYSSVTGPNSPSQLNLPFLAADLDHAVKLRVIPVRSDGKEGEIIDVPLGNSKVGVTEEVQAKIGGHDTVFNVTLLDVTKDAARSMVIEHGKLKFRKGRKTLTKTAIGPTTTIELLEGLRMSVKLGDMAFECEASDAMSRNVLVLSVNKIKAAAK